MTGFTGVHEIGRCAGAGKCRSDLARDVSGFAHAAHDHSPLAGEDEIQRSKKMLVYAFDKSLNGGGFYGEYPTCEVESVGCGSERFVHVANYNSDIS